MQGLLEGYAGFTCGLRRGYAGLSRGYAQVTWGLSGMTQG